MGGTFQDALVEHGVVVLGSMRGTLSTTAAGDVGHAGSGAGP